LAEKKNTKKKQNSETPNPQPEKSFSMPHYTEKVGGLPCCQTLAPNLLEDANQQCLSCSLFVCPPSIPVGFIGSLFFSFFFFFPFLYWFN
jgi:hypothetical protein